MTEKTTHHGPDYSFPSPPSPEVHAAPAEHHTRDYSFDGKTGAVPTLEDYVKAGYDAKGYDAFVASLKKA